MVLLITLAHRTDDAVDERDLVLRDAVFLVEVRIGPGPIPPLYGDPAVHAAKDVLGRLS